CRADGRRDQALLHHGPPEFQHARFFCALAMDFRSQKPREPGSRCCRLRCKPDNAAPNSAVTRLGVLLIANHHLPPRQWRSFVTARIRAEADVCADMNAPSRFATK